MSPHRLAGAAGAILLAVWAGCGPTIRSVHEGSGDPCEVVKGSSAPEDTITVVVTDSITINVPLARNVAERLLFDLMYQTLLTIDCSNELRPGLAESWAGNGRQWTFRLRPDVRFWDGESVTAADVAQGWRFSGLQFESLVALDDRTLEVRFARPLRDARIFASPNFAVGKMVNPFILSVGTGPYRTDDNDITRGDLLFRPAFGANDPTIHLVMVDKRDVRDMLAKDVDLVITGDPELIEYAAGELRFTTTPLMWNRTYALLAPSRVQALREGRSMAALPTSFTEALARDAVRAEARAAEMPAWWAPPGDCFEEWDMNPRAFHARGPRRIVFDLHDATARDLAERLVAVAAMDPLRSAEAGAVAAAVPGLVGGSPPLVAVGLELDDMITRLGSGSDVAFIVALPHVEPDACTAARNLTRAVPWLAPQELALADVLIPLVDTRPHAIVARGRVGLVLNGFGGVTIKTGASQVETSP